MAIAQARRISPSATRSGVGSVAAPSGRSQLLIKAKGKKRAKLNRI
jgi:hypothetical protein